MIFKLKSVGFDWKYVNKGKTTNCLSFDRVFEVVNVCVNKIYLNESRFADCYVLIPFSLCSRDSFSNNT